MVILLQSMATQFCRVFFICRITKYYETILLQSVADCYCKVCEVLQSVTDFIITCSKNYKAITK